jgi:preprotein translocase subunit SecB
VPSLSQPQPGNVQIGLGAQYIRDFSFESPAAPQIFMPTQSAPDINMGVNVHSRGIGENSYEVLLALKMDAKLDGKTAFIAELSYGGVFAIPPMPEEQMKIFLLVEAPRLLFPFARAILSNTVREGGFPQIMITPIDFMALYTANKGNVGTMPTAGVA